MSLLNYFSPVKKNLATSAAALSTAVTKRPHEASQENSVALGSADKRPRTAEEVGTPSVNDSVPPANVPATESSALPSQDPASASLTEAQVERMEANRVAALEKRRQAEEKKSANVDLNTVTYANLETLLVSESWRKLLQNEFKKPYFSALKRFLVQEQTTNQKVFPPLPRIFHAFDVCPVEIVKVVIIGQDPYHDDGQAEGLCFSVPKGVRTPSSLQNIYRELGSCIPGFKKPTHGHLGAWGEQGVLLLNTGLTVRAHQANSHNNKGWQTFTDAAIAQLSSQREGLVFFLWGKHAQDKEKLINKSKHHTILKAAHPSGLSANKGFFGCRHFALANEALVKQGKSPINWQL